MFSSHLSLALTSVAQWVGCCPIMQRVAGSIPSQGTCLGCSLSPQRQPIDVSLLLFLPSFPLLLKVNKLINLKNFQKALWVYNKKKFLKGSLGLVNLDLEKNLDCGGPETAQVSSKPSNRAPERIICGRKQTGQIS